MKPTQKKIDFKYFSVMIFQQICILSRCLSTHTTNNISLIMFYSINSVSLKTEI